MSSRRDRGFQVSRPETHVGQLAYSVRRPVVCPAGNGEWESIEMVRRYAHLAHNHLTEHARQIDSILGGCVPNMSHMEKIKEG